MDSHNERSRSRAAKCPVAPEARAWHLQGSPALAVNGKVRRLARVSTAVASHGTGRDDGAFAAPSTTPTTADSFLSITVSGRQTFMTSGEDFTAARRSRVSQRTRRSARRLPGAEPSTCRRSHRRNAGQPPGLVSSGKRWTGFEPPKRRRKPVCRSPGWLFDLLPMPRRRVPAHAVEVAGAPSYGECYLMDDDATRSRCALSPGQRDGLLPVKYRRQLANATDRYSTLLDQQSVRNSTRAGTTVPRAASKAVRLRRPSLSARFRTGLDVTGGRRTLFRSCLGHHRSFDHPRRGYFADDFAQRHFDGADRDRQYSRQPRPRREECSPNRGLRCQLRHRRRRRRSRNARGEVVMTTPSSGQARRRIKAPHRPDSFKGKQLKMAYCRAVSRRCSASRICRGPSQCFRQAKPARAHRR